MKRLAGLAALGLAACGTQPSGSAIEAANRADPAPVSPAATTSAQRQIGTVSGLKGAASDLKGLVSDFQVRQTATATVAILAADTLFAFDSATISPDAADNLRRTADLVRQGAPGAIKVIGHTDGKGGDAYNDQLSKRRAQAVADWLRGAGGASARGFEVEGRGRHEPVAPNAKPDGSDDPEGRARNRRVEVVIPRT